MSGVGGLVWVVCGKKLVGAYEFSQLSLSKVAVGAKDHVLVVTNANKTIGYQI